MATLEMQRPKRLSAAQLHRSPDLASAPLTPSSPTIIRTSDFILLPSVPTHEPEDNLPSPMALQHQFAVAAHNDAQARRRSQHNSLLPHALADEAQTLAKLRRQSSCLAPASDGSHDQDELEEMAEPEHELEFAHDWNPTATHDALRDSRNQQLEQLQSLLHSLAEMHFERASSSSAPHAEITQILDDMFASLRLIAGHSAPLSPTFARSPSAAPGADADRLVLLVDRLATVLGNVEDAQQAGMLANLTSLVHALFVTDRRMSRAALDSPIRSPKVLAAPRHRSMIRPPQPSPPSSTTHRSASRGSLSSTQSYATLSTSSDEATPTASGDLLQQYKQPNADVPTHGPEQQHVDGSVFDMATVRQASCAKPNDVSLDSLYAHGASALGLVVPQSPRSDQASRAASIAARSDSTALPNRNRFSVQTDSATSTALPGYASDSPGYDAVSHASLGKKAPRSQTASESDDLPQYEHGAAAEKSLTANDEKKPLAEAPTLLERRRAKMAAQHSAYAARSPEDLAVVQSSIDRLSTVMPQLDNQRALSPEDQREAQLHSMIGRLSESSSKRLNDQRSNPPAFRASRPAPLTQTASPESASAVPTASARVEVDQAGDLPQLDAVRETAHEDSAVGHASEVPATPTTPAPTSSSTSSRRSSLLPGAFGRKLSMASIGKALRRASIYDTTKVKPKEDHDVPAFAAVAAEERPSGDATARRRRAATHDSRAKSDIADTLSSMFGEGNKSGKDSASNSAAKLASQTGFRAVDFADDTPRGRDASLMPRASVEEGEDDSMLDDYSFASIDTRTSNHRLSLVGGEPLRSPVSWTSSNVSSNVSRGSSRRSSQLTSNPATPTWPRSPLTPEYTMASKRASNGSMLKPSVTFATDPLPPSHHQPPTRETALSPLRPRKYLAPAAFTDPACASATTAAAAAAAAATATAASKHDLIVYSMFSASLQSNNATDTSARSVFGSMRQFDQVEIDFLAEAQHTLGSVSVMLWSTHTSATRIGGSIELAYELIDVQEQGGLESRTLHIAPMNDQIQLECVARQSDERVVGNSNSSSNSSSGEERKQGRDHVSSGASNGVRIALPAAAVFPQSGRVTLNTLEGGGVGAVARLKLTLTQAECQAAAQESRAEGMVEFPLSAAELSSGENELTCGVCKVEGNEAKPLMKSDAVKWVALPSEGWEELVDAWMCHADQELNRSLTETAVRFASKIGAGEGDKSEERPTEGETVWVGDAYLLVPRTIFDPAAITFDDKQNQTVVRCLTCRSVLGEPSSTAAPPTGATIKLNKYMLETRNPCASSASTSTWLSVLLSMLQYSAASHGSRRFLLKSRTDAVEVWLFSRALFTTSLATKWSLLGGDGESRRKRWKGSRVFFRPPSEAARAKQADGEGAETIDLPDVVFGWLMDAMQQCHASLPRELGSVLPEWKCAYLANVFGNEGDAK